MHGDVRGNRADVGVLFVDLLFALVVVELLEPMRAPGRIAPEGWWQLGLTLALTLLSWIGYHLSLSRANEPIHVDAPPFVHLVLDVAMVAAYWLCAVSFERTDSDYSWASIGSPSAVPEAIFVTSAFLLYVAWDWTARWIKGPWARNVRKRIESNMRTPYGDEIQVWRSIDLERWKKRTIPTYVCLFASGVLLVAAVLTQIHSHDPVATRRWVIGLDIGLIAVVVGFRAGKEMASYPSRVNKVLAFGCIFGWYWALGTPAILTMV